MRRWTRETGKAGVRKRANLRLQRAAEMGLEVRRTAWQGVVIVGGPMCGMKMRGANLYLQPGAARFDVHWTDGAVSRASRAEILRYLAKVIPRPRRNAE